MSNIRFVGLDVHAETIAVAVAEGSGSREIRSYGVIANRPEAIRKLVKKLGRPEQLRACYEAGPCGYVLYWQLSELGVACEVVAPTLIPVKAGERVKTDRRDAEKLARLYRSGELTAVWVPDAEHEALRDLVRAREAAIKDQLRARHRLGKFLLRHGLRPIEPMKAWSQKYEQWLGTLKFTYASLEATFLDYRHEVTHAGERIERLEKALDEAIARMPQSMQAVVAALQALRGVAKTTAATLVAEVGNFSRFDNPRELMSYAGVVPSEHSSGANVRRGAITKAGNAHVRRVLVESAWCNRSRPNLGYVLKKRQQGLSAEVKEIAWKAQHRLYRRSNHLVSRGKPHSKVVTAIARELLGFVWAIGVQAEKEVAQLERKVA